MEILDVWVGMVDFHSGLPGLTWRCCRSHDAKLIQKDNKMTWIKCIRQVTPYYRKDCVSRLIPPTSPHKLLLFMGCGLLQQLVEGLESKRIFICGEGHDFCSSHYFEQDLKCNIASFLIPAGTIRSILISKSVKTGIVFITSKLSWNPRTLATRQGYWLWSHIAYWFPAATTCLSLTLLPRDSDSL